MATLKTDEHGVTISIADAIREETTKLGAENLKLRNETDNIKEDIRDIREQSVPRIVFDVTTARMAKIIRFSLIINLVLGILLGGICGLVVYERSQYDLEDVYVDSQDGGNANYKGASGVINNGVTDNGEGYSQEAGQEEPQEGER